MNATNHHKIIALLGLDANKTKVLENASDFTDDFCNDSNSNLGLTSLDLEKLLRDTKVKFNQSKYFYFHFYYDIECKKEQCGEGKITLRRSKKDENRAVETIGKCTLGKNKKKYQKESIDEIKEFFTFINGREKYLTKDLTDSSNQSDCVAFLHAMAAKDEESEQDKLVFEDPGEDKALKRLKELEKEDWKKVLDNLQDQLSVAGLLPGIGTGSSSNTSSSNGSETARSVFEDHLKKCFAEFLFLKDDEALFMLGIALHGIMDSFTPSHTTFQRYLCQNMALHAQGDVVPIKPQNTKSTDIAIDKFDPGEANAETKVIGGKSVILSLLKGYGESVAPLGYLNTFEYRMLWIYFLISDISPTINGVGKELSLDKIQRLWKTFDGYSLKQINDILNKGYIYGYRAWVYSDNAIKAVSEIYSYLDKEKDKINNYTTYLQKKDDIIGEALSKWKNIYDKMFDDKEFKKKQNLLRLIIKEEGGMMNNIKTRLSDEWNTINSKLDSVSDEFLIWSGDAIDTITNKLGKD